MERKISALHYLIGYAAIVLLVSLNLGLSFLDLGATGLFLTGLLSAASVIVVVLVFMHLLEHAPTVLLVVVSGVFFLALLASLMILDVVARTPEAQPSPPPDTMQERG